MIALMLALAGCTAPVDPSQTDAPPTWCDVQPVFAERCSACHQPGGAGGVPLVTYQEVLDEIDWVQARIHAGGTDLLVMPPNTSTASEACDPVAPFSNELSLSPDELQLLDRWIAASAPLGECAEEPATLPSADAALEGAVVYPNASGYATTPNPAGGSADEFVCFTVDLGSESSADGWFDGIAILADPAYGGNPEIVHHVGVFADADGVGAGQVEPGTNRYPCPDGTGLPLSAFVASWLPGEGALEAPAGAAFRLAPGSDLVYRVHYHMSDIRERAEDHTGLAIRWTDEVPGSQALFLLMGNYTHAPVADGTGSATLPFEIPQAEGAAVSFIETEQLALEWPVALGDLPIWAVGGHMHLAGAEISIRRRRRGEPPDSGDCLLHQDWNFDWQPVYRYVPASAPSLLPGDVVSLTCRYENTNPWPLELGEGSNDEMCAAALGVLVPLSEPGAE